MKIREILAGKGHGVVTVGPEAVVKDALGLLVDRGIGSVVVLDGGEIAGILTERDILRLTHRDPGAVATVRVRDLMTRELVVGVPDDDVQYVMEIMTRNRVRHLPVVDGNALAGIISIGDVVNAMRRDAETENRYLRDYVQGVLR